MADVLTICLRFLWGCLCLFVLLLYFMMLCFGAFTVTHACWIDFAWTSLL